MKHSISLLAILISVLLLASCNLDIGNLKTPILGSSEVVASTPSKAKVIILSGQSNASGCSLVSQIPAQDSAKYSNGFDNVLIRCDTDTVHTESFVKTKAGQGAGSDYFGPELGLAEVLNDAYGETVYIIKYSRGGRSLSSDYYPDYDREKSVDYRGLIDWIDSSLQVLRNDGLDPEIIAFVWMQGENDACFLPDSFKYYENENLLLNELRSRYSDSSIPGGFFFIDGGITPIWRHFNVINDAKIQLASEKSRCVYVNSNANGLFWKNDDIAHFNSPSMLKLGALFANQIIAHVH